MLSNSFTVAAYNIEELEGAPSVSVNASEENTFLGWLELCKGDEPMKWTRFSKQKQIIEQFIQTEPKIQPVKGVLNELRDFEADVKSSKKDINAMIVSETLAKIYYQQKKYSLCIDTYRQLSLVNPEKSTYFASLIKKIEKEIV
jgi:hypothetical protein